MWFKFAISTSFLQSCRCSSLISDDDFDRHNSVDLYVKIYACEGIWFFLFTVTIFIHSQIFFWMSIFLCERAFYYVGKSPTEIKCQFKIFLALRCYFFSLHPQQLSLDFSKLKWKQILLFYFRVFHWELREEQLFQLNNLKIVKI